MKRNVFAAAALAVVASVSVASAEKSNPSYAFDANPASAAALSAPAAHDVRRLLGSVDLSSLDSAEVGAIEGVLASDDSNGAAAIRAILAGEQTAEATRADFSPARLGGNGK